MTRRKTSLSISLPSSKLTISLILFTAHLFLKFVIFLGGLEVWQWLCAAFQKCRRTDISWRPEGRGVLKLIYSWLLLLSLLLLWLLLFYSWGQKSRRDLLKTIVKGTCTPHPPLRLYVNLVVRNYFLVTFICALSYPFPLLLTIPRIMIQTEVTWWGLGPNEASEFLNDSNWGDMMRFRAERGKWIPENLFFFSFDYSWIPNVEK